jgi:hypothetical protein
MTSAVSAELKSLAQWLGLDAVRREVARNRPLRSPSACYPHPRRLRP